jgi:glucose/arabinose dehydrogenase
LENYKSLGRSKSKSPVQQPQQPIYAVINKTGTVSDVLPAPPRTDSTSTDSQQPVKLPTSPVTNETATIVTSPDEPLYAVVDKQRKFVENQRTTSPTAINNEVSVSEDSSVNGDNDGSHEAHSVNISAPAVVTHGASGYQPLKLNNFKDIYATVDGDDHIYQSIDDVMRTECNSSDVEPYATWRPPKQRPDPNAEKTGILLFTFDE